MRAAPGKARFSIMAITTIEQAAAALKFEIAGMVQGVGFRPHVYRLAVRHGLKGFVRNTESGVEIHVEGEPGASERFWTALMDGLPEHARVYGVERTVCEPAGFERFHPRRRSGDAAGSGSVPGVPGRNARPVFPPVSLSVYQLHALRSPLFYY